MKRIHKQRKCFAYLVGLPKMPRKLKKACFNDRWNYGLTKYVHFNKRQPNPGYGDWSIASQIAMWYCFKSQEHRGYIADTEITKHRLFKLRH